MKKIILSVSLMAAMLMAGCSTTNVSELTKALANDPATVQVNVSSVYGTLRFTRVGGQPAGVKTTVAPDGTITMTQDATAAAAKP